MLKTVTITILIILAAIALIIALSDDLHAQDYLKAVEVNGVIVFEQGEIIEGQCSLINSTNKT